MRKSNMNGTRLWVIAVVIAILANILILSADSLLLQFASSFILVCLLPGFMLINVLIPGLPDLLERAVLGVGAGYALLVLGGLVMHFLPGAITPRLVLLAYNVLILIFTLCLMRGGDSSGQRRPLPKSVIWQVILIVVLASFFRLTFLGYSEFQDDEAKVMLKAAGAIQGRDDVLFLHKKGPAEILIPAIFYSISERTDEFIARFPFALANLIGLMAMYLLGRRMFNERVGFVAALLLAIEGYLIAFSRITQYQSVVFLMVILSIFCFYRFCCSGEDSYGYLVLGSLFAGIGLLAHYEAFFTLPVDAYLFLKKARAKRWKAGKWMQVVTPPLLALSFVVLSFYLPFILHPHFRETCFYIAESRMGGGIPYNNLPDFLIRSTFYNSTYYIVFLTLLIVAAAIGALVARRAPIELRALFLWFAVPFILYLFLMRKVHTHYYVIFTPWALIGGMVIDRWQKSVRRATTGHKLAFGFTSAFAIALVIVFAYYTYMVFVQHNPEYKRTYPEHKSRFYWTPYSEIPSYGYFGFPYRAGWKVIGYLYDKGVLKGDYDSNEEGYITRWYTRGQLRCSYNPQYYFVAENVQDQQRIPFDEIEEGYRLVGIVLVDDKPKLRIYERGQADLSQVATYRLEDYEPLYNKDMTSPNFDAGIPKYDPASLIQHPLEVNLGNKVKLIGYDLDSTRIKRGDALLLTLYWQGIERLEEDYKVFVHLETDRILAQEDHVPACGARPTTTWKPGEVIVDRYSLLIAPHTPAGRYPILVGMYEPSTSRRMKMFDEWRKAGGDAIPLREVTVIP